MARYALVDGNGIVRNVVAWDGGSGWTPPVGLDPVEITRPDDGGSGPPTEFHVLASSEATVVAGRLTVTNRWAAPPLADVKAILKARVNSAAEAARLSFVTPGSAQAMVYLGKYMEAQACLADNAPTPDKYKLLAATVGVDGADVSAVAQTVMARHAAWTAAGAAIEQVKFAGLTAVDAAVDVEGAVAAYDGIIWPQTPA